MVESKNSWGADNQNKEQKAGGEWSEDRSEITKSSPKNDKEAWGDKNKGGEQKAAGWDATDNSESWGGGGGGSSATANTDFGSKDRGGDRGERKERPPREENASGESTTVFVGGLGYRTTEETVNEFFGTAGTVVGVRIAMNQEDNRPRGFCHVEFDTPESAQKAVDTLSGQALDGRNIRIEISRPRGGGGRGGGGAGRGDRTGSGCYKCGEEGHISRDCPQGGGGAGRGGGGGSRACYKCGEEGHISRECPQAGEDSRGGGGRGGGDRGGQSGSRACYKCGEEGHISRDCPQASGSGDRGGGRGGGGGSRACYKCGEEGHIARDCSQEGGDNDRGGGGRPRGGGGYGGSYSGSREFSDHSNVNSDPYKRSNNDSKGWSGGAGGEAKDSGSGWNGDSRGNEGGAWK